MTRNLFAALATAVVALAASQTSAFAAAQHHANPVKVAHHVHAGAISGGHRPILKLIPRPPHHHADHGCGNHCRPVVKIYLAPPTHVHRYTALTRYRTYSPYSSYRAQVASPTPAAPPAPRRIAATAPVAKACTGAWAGEVALPKKPGRWAVAGLGTMVEVKEDGSVVLDCTRTNDQEMAEIAANPPACVGHWSGALRLGNGQPGSVVPLDGGAARITADRRIVLSCGA